MKNFVVVFFVLTTLCFSGVVFAKTTPKNHEAPTLETGELRVDAIYSAEGRLVIDDKEMYVKQGVDLNGQSISSSALLTILREGQKLRRIKVEKSGAEQKRFLVGVDTL
jgi:hypothetical protein